MLSLPGTQGLAQTVATTVWTGSLAGSSRASASRWHRVLASVFFFAAGLLLLAGCASPRPTSCRPFVFGEDTFAYENGLVWEYYYDAQGKWVARKREPAADYTHHCFPVARSAKEFFLKARFDPALPKVSDEECRKLVRRVLAGSARTGLPEEKKVVIPGYTNLTQFSREHERLLKEECGSAVSSYFQRGHWRMILPFSGAQRERTARQLCENVRRNCPAVIHVATFPSLTINHALVVFQAQSEEGEIIFKYYDPNDPERPGSLVYDKLKRSFNMEANDYFPGGTVQVYEVFHRWNY